MVYFLEERLPELSSDHGWKVRKLPGKLPKSFENLLVTFAIAINESRVVLTR